MDIQMGHYSNQYVKHGELGGNLPTKIDINTKWTLKWDM